MNTYVIGDIHGAYRALKQALERTPLKDGDRIICLADYVDGWSESFEVIELLLSLKEKYEMIFLLGNHDLWLYEYTIWNIHGSQWHHGANATRYSYIRNSPDKKTLFIPENHRLFLSTLKNYFVDENNNCYVHGGYDWLLPINQQVQQNIYYSDRELWSTAFKEHNSIDGFSLSLGFNNVFLGHSATTKIHLDIPLKAGNVYNLDTGAGFDGKLTIMNVETKEYWQSDVVATLYPNERGRG